MLMVLLFSQIPCCTTFLMATLFMSDAPVDEDALLELVDEDSAFLETLVNTFLEDCTDYMDNIRRAVDEEDTETLLEEAHGLKGAVANLQAEPARRAAHRMEELGRQDTLDDASDALQDLEQQIERLRAELRELVRTHT